MRRGGIERVRARARAPVNVARRTIGLFPPGSSFFFRGRRSLLALKGNLKSSPPPLALTARRSHARIPPRSPGLMLQYDPHCDARGSPLASRAGGTDRKGRGEGGGERALFSNFGEIESSGTRPRSAFARQFLPPAGRRKTSRGAPWEAKDQASARSTSGGAREGGDRGPRGVKRSRSKLLPSFASWLSLLPLPPKKVSIGAPRAHWPPRALVTDLDGAAARRRDRAHRGHGPEHGRGHLERRSGLRREKGKGT